MPNRYLHIQYGLQMLVVLCVGLSGTAALVAKIGSLEYETARIDFERRAAQRVATIHDGLNGVVQVVAVVNRLFSTVGAVSPEQFQTFTHPLLAANPSIQNVAFHRRVSAADRGAFEAGMRVRHPDFTISEFVDGKRVPAAQKEGYRVVEYIQPLKGNEAVLGLDTSAGLEQDEAQRRACRTGLPYITRAYQPEQQKSAQRGFVILMPVYRGGTFPADEDARCRSVVGYTSAAFSGATLVGNSLAQRRLDQAAGFEIDVYGGASTSDQNLVYRTPGSRHAGFADLPLIRTLLHTRVPAYSNEFDVAGKTWHVVVSPSSRFLFSTHLGALSTLAGGLLATLLAMTYVHSAGSRSRRIRRLMEEHTEELNRVQKLLKANRLLDTERNQLLSLFEQSPGFVTVLNGPQHVFTIANASYRSLLGNRPLIGKSVREALPDLEGQGFFELLDGVYSSGEPYVGRGVPIRIRNGLTGAFDVRYVDFIYQPITDEDGVVNGIFVQGSDVSAEKVSQMQLQYVTTHDTLTDLPNYALLRDRLGQTILRAEAGKHSFVVMVVDLDRFKLINESLGHGRGDLILKTIAGRLKAITQENHTLARMDGDKFALIFSESTNQESFSTTAQRLMEAVSKAIELDDGQELFLSCSVGMAAYPTDAVTEEDLLQCADIAMHRAKDMGGNNFQFYTPKMNERNREKLKITSALRNAIERSELVLHYQPQVDLLTGQIVGMEALIRWQHPELGLVPPGTFIELAEETGLIIPIGTWVLQTACKQAIAWKNAGLQPLRIAVNLSARQFSQDGIADTIANILAETGLPPACLDIELTESLVMLDVDYAIDVLGDLKELGVQLSIDDFGTGYSSLSYLKRFPIDVLKIDRSFITGIPSSTDDGAIADAIISMAHSLGIRVIAEGVETEAQCAFLAGNMCDEIQGFLFSAALPAAEMEALLREQQVLPKHLLRLHKPPRTLLLVDDEPSILSALRRRLRGHGYQILTAASGKEGLDLLAQNDVDVIISDQRMPGMTGVEFLRTVKTLYPDTVRIVLSGFTELKSVTDAVNEGAIYKFLTKPWEDQQLLDHINEAFQHKEMVNENRRLNLEVRAANQELARANRLLEEVLEKQQRQIERGEVSLDIVREALQYVPLPVIGLDDDEMIVLANTAAQELFREKGAILGTEAVQIMPELLHAMRNQGEDMRCMIRMDGKWLEAMSRTMGNGTQSRGKLITLLDVADYR